MHPLLVWVKQNIKRITELMFVNNKSMKITTIGYIKEDQNKYGRVGITVQEAVELSYYRGVIEGVMNLTGAANLAPEISRMIKEEAEGAVIQIASPEEISLLLKEKKRVIQ